LAGEWVGSRGGGGERRLTESFWTALKDKATSYYQQDDENDKEKALVLIVPVLDGWETLV
jgi:hypothetical protein